MMLKIFKSRVPGRCQEDLQREQSCPQEISGCSFPENWGAQAGIRSEKSLMKISPLKGKDTVFNLCCSISYGTSSFAGD